MSILLATLVNKRNLQRIKALQDYYRISACRIPGMQAEASYINDTNHYASMHAFIVITVAKSVAMLYYSRYYHCIYGSWRQDYHSHSCYER